MEQKLPEKDLNQTHNDASNCVRRLWVFFFCFLLLLAVVIPFTVLSDVPKIYGSFLFWALFAVTAIISVGYITGQWRD